MLLALLSPLFDHETLQYPPVQQGLIVQHSSDAGRHASNTKAAHHRAVSLIYISKQT